MSKKLIEAVCTANNGRSPVIERLAKNRLVEIGADREYDAISSGTMVDAIARGGHSISHMRYFVDLATERGDIYSPGDLRELEGALEREDGVVVEKFYDQAVGRFLEEEHANKAEALRTYGIEGDVKDQRTQTVARGDVVAVLPADTANYKRVGEIYVPSGHTPTIAVLSQFATGDPTVEMKNAFGRDKESYMRMIETLVDHVPKAVDRIVGA